MTDLFRELDKLGYGRCSTFSFIEMLKLGLKRPQIKRVDKQRSAGILITEGANRTSRKWK